MIYIIHIITINSFMDEWCRRKKILRTTLPQPTSTAENGKTKLERERRKLKQAIALN